jgi:hypothetical protein
MIPLFQSLVQTEHKCLASISIRSKGKLRSADTIHFVLQSRRYLDAVHDLNSGAPSFRGRSEMLGKRKQSPHSYREWMLPLEDLAGSLSVFAGPHVLGCIRLLSFYNPPD